MNIVPGLGSGGGYLIPDKYQAAIQAGIRFFILQYPKRTVVDEVFSGPFDVIAGEEHDYQTNRTRHNMKWITGRDANVVFKVQPNSDIAICYMPDDIFYHNRIMVLDHPEFIVTGMHTADRGIIPAADVIMEIDCLRDEIYYDAPIWKVIDPRKGNKEVDYAWNKEDAEEILRTVSHRTVGNAGFPVEYKPYEKCVLVEGTKKRKKPEIERMIINYARIPNGWTACDEFRNNVIPAVQRRIDAKMNRVQRDEQPITASNMRDAVLSTIASLSDEDIKRLRDIKRPEQEELPVQAEAVGQTDEDAFDASLEPVDIVPQQQEEPSQEVVEAESSGSDGMYKGYMLQKKRVADLQEIASSMGIDAENLTKAKLIELILATQDNMVVT